jgi:predicted CXXCH cytochrome family protein
MPVHGLVATAEKPCDRTLLVLKVIFLFARNRFTGLTCALTGDIYAKGGNIMRLRLISASVAVITIFVTVSTLAHSDERDGSRLMELVKRATETRANPHEGLPCTDCHEGGVPGGPLVGGIGEACNKCHPEGSNIHPVGQMPSMEMPEHLPLTDGKMDCGTCHDMHMDESADVLLRGFGDGRYTVRQDLCMDCHGAGFMKKNPHVNQKERGKCAFCHASEPPVGSTAQSVKFRYGILRTCNFCHDMAGRRHPFNVHEDFSPPAGLPRDVDGSATCATCHDPHGTSGTLHNLRMEYIRALETLRSLKPHEGDCKACHITVPSQGDTREEVLSSMKFEGDITLLCNGCHGSHSVHPTDIPPAKDMKKPEGLPLDKRGNISCITCHDVNWKGEVSMRVPEGAEGVERVEARHDLHRLCAACHDQEKYATINPHQDIMSGEGCVFCHDRVPDVKTDTAASVRFITSERLVCLQCHEPYPHPASSEHMVLPPDRMDVPALLPLDSAGEISCTTCHNPHVGGATGDELGETSRLRIPGEVFCTGCHESKR